MNKKKVTLEIDLDIARKGLAMAEGVISLKDLSDEQIIDKFIEYSKCYGAIGTGVTIDQCLTEEKVKTIIDNYDSIIEKVLDIYGKYAYIDKDEILNKSLYTVYMYIYTVKSLKTIILDTGLPLVSKENKSYIVIKYQHYHFPLKRITIPLSWLWMTEKEIDEDWKIRKEEYKKHTEVEHKKVLAEKEAKERAEYERLKAKYEDEYKYGDE